MMSSVHVLPQLLSTLRHCRQLHHVKYILARRRIIMSKGWAAQVLLIWHLSYLHRQTALLTGYGKGPMTTC